MRGTPTTPPRTDGLSWHNYWDYGPDSSEQYDDCRTGGKGQHVSAYFPAWLKQQIRIDQRPVYITEADLNSPRQNGATAIGVKGINDTQGIDYAFPAAESIRDFFAAEIAVGGSAAHYGVPAYIAAWLLNDDTTDAPDDETCVVGNCVLDHNWHEAYQDVDTNGNRQVSERRWFAIWWTELPEKP
jgi:hypothetical protein